MSFIAIDDRARHRRERAPIAGLTAVRDEMLHSHGAAGSGPSINHDAISRVALTLILLLLPCVLGLAAFKGVLPSLPSTIARLELHPTCSPTRDCWVAPPPKIEQTASAPDARRGPQERTVVANEMAPEPHETFGALVVPPTNWSGPPTAAAAVRSPVAPIKAALPAGPSRSFKKMKTAAAQPARLHAVSE